MSSLELTLVNADGNLITLNLTAAWLNVRLQTRAASTQLPSRAPRFSLRPKSGAPAIPVPIHNIVAATFTPPNTVSVAYLTRKTPKHGLSLVQLSGSSSEKDGQLAKQWCEAAMMAAYQGRSPSKKLKVLINPHGGRGQAHAIFTNKVEPILRAAGCTLDVTSTTHKNHTSEIAQSLSLDYDALVVISGDGLIHEVFNGFSKHAQPDKAFCMPVAPIPAGSGNGLSLNLLGIKDGLDPSAAALNVLKGCPLKVDLFSFTQGDQKRMSFMSQTVGLMADIDIETEHLRWMGDFRFVLGYILSVVTRPTCKMELSIKVAEQDKLTMAAALRARRASASFDAGPPPPWSPSENTDGVDGSPEETWIKYDKPCLWMFAGKGPYVSRSLMQFPVSCPDDGLIDITVQEPIPRKELLFAMDGAERGRCYWFNSNRYFKASAYSAKPLADTRGVLVVDGEPFPWAEFRVDVLPRLGTLLSPHPYYAAEFLLLDEKGTMMKGE
ncbi:hypothetical protein ID866_4252 [Astraeus odoratus]|nr:hypothetical protein ID866_4252 [Astraeus odoratus]